MCITLGLQIPEETQAKIRHVRLYYDERSLIFKPHGAVIRYLVPGLHLDTFTILLGHLSLEEFVGRHADFVIWVLASYGHGWKHLRVLICKSSWLNQDPGDPGAPHMPPPTKWRRCLLRRDGENSGASLSVYISKDRDPIKMLDPDGRVPLDESNIPEQVAVRPSYQTHSDMGVHRQPERGLLIIAARGRRESERRASKVFEAENTGIEGLLDYYLLCLRDREKLHRKLPVVYDAYTDPEEYQWL
ncbi:hypothetical protein F4778DRAFT_223068 [Xylariomycetidae sp. FL2044]|nr:hypothetical protein F4778DRAFT_223068 [Xylariomycetidae sp. FL2044]